VHLTRALGIGCSATIGVFLLSAASASAQTQVGDRVFLHTIFLGEPGVGDDLTVPSFSWSEASDGTPVTSVSAQLSKRITENIGVVISPPAWNRIGSISGFQNLTTTLKYMPLKDAEHQLMMCVGLQVEWGGTGEASIGANSFSKVTPQIYIGKGFGDLPAELSLLRPLSVTGQFGLDMPTQPNTSGDPFISTGGPNVFNWSLSLQYSPQQSGDLRVTPLVEASFQTPVANPLPGQTATTGTISSGLAFSAKGYQLTAEAVFPANTLSGRGVGVAASLTFSFGELFPDTLGKPLFR
jgi:hypothetical protein